MRPAKLALTLMTVLVVPLLAAPPAHAGGWAATVLDPLPTRIEPNQTYTVGYWVMQHAAHPYDGAYGPLGRTGLKIVAEDGTTHTFDGVPLGQPAHYAAALTVPQPGTWQLHARQGRFGDYLIGTLTVPGKLKLRPLPAAVAGHHHDPHRWGLIQAPDLAAMRAQADATSESGTNAGIQGTHRHDNQASPQTASPGSEGGYGVWTPVLWAVLIVGVLGAILSFARWIPARRAGRPPDGGCGVAGTGRGAGTVQVP